jgi:hypothetical protein
LCVQDTQIYYILWHVPQPSIKTVENSLTLTPSMCIFSFFVKMLPLFL